MNLSHPLRSEIPSPFEQLPTGEVGAPHVPHLAGPHQVVQGPQGYFQWRVGVEEVKLEDVDVVGPQSLQAGLAPLDDVLPGVARTSLPGILLGCTLVMIDRFLAPFAQRFAQSYLGVRRRSRSQRR